MATIAPTTHSPDPQQRLVSWRGLAASGDTGADLPSPTFPRRTEFTKTNTVPGVTVAIQGDFGTGVTVELQGSDDLESWQTILQASTPGTLYNQPVPLFIRPVVTAGSGGNVSVLVYGRDSTLA